MNQHNKSFLRRAHKDQRGQTLAMVLVMMVMLLAFSAIVVDFGRVYIAYQQLQASTDAAALAGAAALPKSTATAVAQSYGGASTGKNANPNPYSGVTVKWVSATPLCLKTLTGEGLACVAPANANAIQVVQQATVYLTFAQLAGANSVTLTATSTASMRGAARAPYNVVILLDSTRSMTDSDGGSNCSGSRESCALAGIQVLLQDLSPCAASLSSCGAVTTYPGSPGGGYVTSPVDQVSLLTFPAVTSATTPDDYNCGSSSPTIEPYPLPTSASGYATYSNLPASIPATTYQIVNFSSDYRTSDTATSLNTSSDLVIAANGKTGCTGLQAIGGQGTYYAGAIYSAENLLLAQQAKNLNTQNALIIISDGDANATCKTQASGACTSGELEGNAAEPVSTTSGVYPSTVQQCHQAVTASQWAANQSAVGAIVKGTTVYTVGYGAESSGCTTDTNPTITPCQAMQQMASSPAYFFTDYTSSTNGCVSASQTTTNLDQIFTEIANYFTVARLIPNNTT
jgi:Flp pilus assembly protein TadG